MPLPRGLVFNGFRAPRPTEYQPESRRWGRSGGHREGPGTSRGVRSGPKAPVISVDREVPQIPAPRLLPDPRAPTRGDSTNPPQRECGRSRDPVQCCEPVSGSSSQRWCAGYSRGPGSRARSIRRRRLQPWRAGRPGPPNVAAQEWVALPPGSEDLWRGGCGGWPIRESCPLTDWPA